MADWNQHARAATTANIPNISTTSPGPSIDNVPLNVNDVVLVKDQTNAAENGLYLWKGNPPANPMVRTGDTIVPEMNVRVSEGDLNAHGLHALVTQGAITVGRTGLRLAPQSRPFR